MSADLIPPVFSSHATVVLVPAFDAPPGEAREMDSSALGPPTGTDVTASCFEQEERTAAPMISAHAAKSMIGFLILNCV